MSRPSEAPRSATSRTRVRRKLLQSAVFYACHYPERTDGVRTTTLSKVLSILGKGDTLVVTRLDRLGRSLKDLADIAHEIEKAGANPKVLEQPVDTSTSAGRDFFAVYSAYHQAAPGHRNPPILLAMTACTQATPAKWPPSRR